MPFARFMDRALYEPELGYYRGGPLPWGQDADYVTAPQVHPALGASIARLVVDVDARLGAPELFTLVEVGSGNGQLARVVLATLRDDAPDLWARMRFLSIECGENARAAQADLPTPGGGIAVREALPAAPSAVRGFLYANELLDAFPVHRVRQTKTGLLESHVDLVEGTLVERYCAPSTPAIAAHLEANGVVLSAGQVAEVALGVQDWLQEVHRYLTRGGMLLVDYGHSTESLYGPNRMGGTLVAQQRFALSDDVITCPGDRDLTAHVDFGNLARIAEGLGLSWSGRCSLRVFLIGMGAAADQPDAPVAARMALRHLLVSEIADGHSVVFMHRGLPTAPSFGRARLEEV
jgi:SAM-dependent MidA family methyltransferase